MLIMNTVENAVAGGRRRLFEPGGGGPFEGYTDFLFETSAEQPDGPQAFLVHQAPGCTLPTHFHLQHQIQVVAGGGGTLGRHAVGPGSIHYASPESAYGPLVAGPEGLEYYTLRALTDRGAWYLPDARPAMQAGRKKEQVTADLQWQGDDARACRPIAPRDDGLAAWAFRAAPGDTVRCEGAPSRAGRFHVVLAGAFRAGDRQLPRFACLCWTPPEEAPAFEALEPGSLLVAVQFPDAAADHAPPTGQPVSATRQLSRAVDGEMPHGTRLGGPA